METIPLSKLVFVDTATVSSDGRLYIGREFADKSVKIVVIDEDCEGREQSEEQPAN